MGESSQPLVRTRACAADPFTIVFGRERGLKADVVLEREYDDLDLEALFHRELAAIAGVYFRFREHGGDKVLRLREHLVDTIHFRLRTQTDVGNVLRMMGLGARDLSPWLVAEVHTPRGLVGSARKYNTSIHIADLNCAYPWIDAGADYETMMETKTLCGLDRVRDHGFIYHAHRGSWRWPSRALARRCDHCQTLAQRLTTPALDEKRRCLRTVDALVPPREHVLTLFHEAVTYQDVIAQLEAEARPHALAHLSALAREDPIPILMTVLPPKERRCLHEISQVELQKHLQQIIPWEQVMEKTLDPDTTSGYNASALESTLRDHVRALQPF